MFNSPILDLALALSFTYFILGLLVSTIHEFVFSVLKSNNTKRAEYLKKSIENLFFDSNWKRFATQQLFKNAHFEVLKKDNNLDTFPSYVPNSNFALAIIDQFRMGNNLIDMNQIQSILTDDNLAKQYNIPSDLRKTLLSFLERSNGELTEFQKQLEDYLNSALDRLAGSYVRSTKIYIFLISLILTCALNVDTIHIVKTLWESPDSLKKTADMIQEEVPKITKNPQGINTISNSQEGRVFELNTKFITDSIDAEGLHHIKKNIETSTITLNKVGIPFGWADKNYPASNGYNIYIDWLIKIFGLLLTSFALLLGAPFWFDLLNKIVNIRATGKKDAAIDKPNDKPVQPITVTINQSGEEAVG
jgi:hypothetical protein